MSEFISNGWVGGWMEVKGYSNQKLFDLVKTKLTRKQYVSP
jgi:hypothetical protein